jgi:thiamine pyrophosphate-dependent acetolactate synthase large subunit-like protein
MGAKSYQIDKAADIGSTVIDAFKQSIPSVIEIMTDPSILNEPYRRDALKFPVRELAKYRKYTNNSD